MGRTSDMYRELAITTGTEEELIDITPLLQDAVHECGVEQGICYLFVPHTTAGITLNENWDPTVREDLIRALQGLVPRVGPYRHAEGNSAAHIKASLVGSSVAVPIRNGVLLLGAWQGVYLAEFDGPRRRRVVVQFFSL